MQTIYKRLMIFGLLCICLIVFGLSDEIETVYARPCFQECDANRAMCEDNCAVNCTDNGDLPCDSCLADCRYHYQSCARVAISCYDSGPSYTPNCQVDFTPHCPVINGQPNCSHQDAHYGYTLTCQTLGGNNCVACPDHDWRCTANGGFTPSCY